MSLKLIVIYMYVCYIYVWRELSIMASEKTDVVVWATVKSSQVLDGTWERKQRSCTN